MLLYIQNFIRVSTILVQGFNHSREWINNRKNFETGVSCNKKTSIKQAKVAKSRKP